MLDYDFWHKYFHADELERHKMIETLPLFKKSNGKTRLFAYGASATMLQSYFDDILEFAEAHEADND